MPHGMSNGGVAMGLCIPTWSIFFFLHSPRNGGLFSFFFFFLLSFVYVMAVEAMGMLYTTDSLYF